MRTHSAAAKPSKMPVLATHPLLISAVSSRMLCSPPSPPTTPPQKVTTNVNVSPAGDGGVQVLVATPPAPGPQTDVSVNVPGVSNQT